MTLDELQTMVAALREQFSERDTLERIEVSTEVWELIKALPDKSGSRFVMSECPHVFGVPIHHCPEIPHGWREVRK